MVLRNAPSHDRPARPEGFSVFGWTLVEFQLVVVGFA